jgi:hypothetical protein
MTDNGYDTNNEHIINAFDDWSERIANTQLPKELDYIPDTVAMLGCLKYAARMAKKRRDLMTNEMVVQILRNYLDAINPDHLNCA